MARDEAYRRAEEKIEEARRTGATRLDLSCSHDAKDSEKLTELPESLAALTQLQTLYLSNNQLTALPESLGQLTQLQTLYLSNNQLTTLPEWLGQLTQLQTLNLSRNQLTALPECLAQLTQLRTLDLSENQLTALGESLGQLTQLQTLHLSSNQLTALPESFGNLSELKSLYLGSASGGNPLVALPCVVGRLKTLELLWVVHCKLKSLPQWLRELPRLRDFHIDENEFTDLPNLVGELTRLEYFNVRANRLRDLPPAIGKLKRLRHLILQDNPLTPELAAAYEQGLDAVKEYLRAKGEGAVVLNEAKLILIGEGEVGKSCLLDALRDEPWQKHVSTHGIEIKPVVVIPGEISRNALASGSPEEPGASAAREEPGASAPRLISSREPATITLNTWDFGGQKVYRPTHQLFFSAPAVYLVVWKPREGPQQGAVEYWINTIKHRAGPDAKVLVVATHGGPQQRQPDIDLQDLRDKFGADCVLGSFHVDNRPPNYDEATDT